MANEYLAVFINVNSFFFSYESSPWLLSLIFLTPDVLQLGADTGENKAFVGKTFSP